MYKQTSKRNVKLNNLEVISPLCLVDKWVNLIYRNWPSYHHWFAFLQLTFWRLVNIRSKTVLKSFLFPDFHPIYFGHVFRLIFRVFSKYSHLCERDFWYFIKHNRNNFSALLREEGDFHNVQLETLKTAKW